MCTSTVLLEDKELARDLTHDRQLLSFLLFFFGETQTSDTPTEENTPPSTGAPWVATFLT